MSDPFPITGMDGLTVGELSKEVLAEPRHVTELRAEIAELREMIEALRWHADHHVHLLYPAGTYTAVADMTVSDAAERK